MNLVKRMKATQRTLDKFKGRKFKDGTADCIQLVLAHARHMGRKITVPKYKDTKTAADVLRQLGFRTLGKAMDHHFERIDPHQVLLGDIVEGPGANGFSSLGIALGGGRALGFHEEVPHCDIVHPTIVTGAWRINPSPRAA
jgi:hypothetical protein